MADACILGKIEAGDSVTTKNEFVEEGVVAAEVAVEAALFEGGAESALPVE
jgi:hypothetical protein